MTEQPETTEMTTNIDKPEEPPKPKKRRGCLRKLFYTFLIFFAVLLAIRLVAGCVMQSRFDAKIAELRAAGALVEWQDLVPPEIPDEENAAVFYGQAFEQMELLPKDTRDNPHPLAWKQEEWTPEELAKARVLLEKATEVFRLLRKGGKLDKSRYPIDYDVSPDEMSLPHLAKMLAAARLLGISSRVNLHDGKVDAATRDVVQMFKLSQSSRAEAIHISQMVEGSVCGLALRQLEVVMNASHPSPEVLQKVTKVLEDVEDRTRYARAMEGERYEGIAHYQTNIDESAGYAYCIFLNTDGCSKSSFDFLAPPIIYGIAFGLRPVFLSDALNYLDTMETHVKTAEGTFAERQTGRKFLAEKMLKMKSEWIYSRIWSHLLLTPLEKAHINFDGDVATKSLAKCAIGLRLYRMKHGKYPTDLAAIAPQFVDKIPEDPFSGKPLIYRTEAKGFIIYSVGQNRVDDGGTFERGNKEEGDIVWECSQ